MPFPLKKNRKKPTRLFYATDLHGSERTYRKFINAGKFYGVDILVMGGDITGKLLIPVIKEGSGYRATLQGRTEHLSTEAELQGLLERLGTLGFYHKIMDEEEFRATQSAPAAIDSLFHELARKRLEAWVDLAENRLKGTGIKCFVTGGNDDDPDVLQGIHRAGTESFLACEGQVVAIDDEHTMISVGYSTPTPWKTPREIPDERLADMIAGMISQASNVDRCIFNFHDPPVDSTLDTCPMLDWSTDPPQPIIKAGQVVMHGAGSKAVRRAIETHQPMLGLHGHALLSLLLLVSGFKNYVKVQYVMFYSILVAFGTMLVVLFTTSPASFVEHLNAFAVASGGAANFYQTAVEATKAAGIDLNPPFSIWATLLVAPIAWTSLQWATYSAEQNGEIKDARSFKNQVFILVGSLIVTGILLALLAAGIERVGGSEFLAVSGAGYWSGVAEAKISGFWLWPNILAVALTASPIVVLIIALGYILNSFQIVCNCYIGVTRIMVGMSLDRLLPEWVSRVHEKLHTPVNAHLAYFLASIPIILVYNLWGPWYSLTLGVTFACGYVFAASSLAGAVLPYRAKEVYEASPGAKYKLGKIPWVTILGGVGFVFGSAMVLSYMFAPQLGLVSVLAYSVVFGIIAISAIWYFLAKQAQKARGINVDYAFKEIPPE